MQGLVLQLTRIGFLVLLWLFVYAVIRTLRADIEPDDVCARLGLYSMDAATPLSATSSSALESAAFGQLRTRSSIGR